MKYLMWDVDGTLILSGGAGKDAMIKVIKDYYFLDAFDFNKSLAGRTDSDIIKSVVTRLRGRCNSAEAAGLLIRYHMELPKQLPLHKGRVLKNVEKTLQYFCQPLLQLPAYRQHQHRRPSQAAAFRSGPIF